MPKQVDYSQNSAKPEKQQRFLLERVKIAPFKPKASGVLWLQGDNFHSEEATPSPRDRSAGSQKNEENGVWMVSQLQDDAKFYRLAHDALTQLAQPEMMSLCIRSETVSVAEQIVNCLLQLAERNEFVFSKREWPEVFQILQSVKEAQNHWPGRDNRSASTQ